MRRPLLFVAGRDPRTELGGGHSAYVRAHALAAQRAGFEPHLFCVGPTSGIEQAEFGIVHRTFSPFRPYRALMIPFHGPLLIPAVARFAAAQPPPRVIHSFGVWGYVGVRASERLAREGLTSVPILSSYATHEAEVRSKVESFSNDYPLWERVRMRIELGVVRRLWRFERRAYCGSTLVLHNYESVKRLIRDRHGLHVRCRKISYAAEPAFQSEASATTPPSDIARLKPGTAPLLVSVSRHDPRKGVDVLLEALARLKRDGVAFRACLVGGGRLLKIHRDLCAKLGLDDSVVLPGEVPSSWSYLEHADVFCLPSRFEQSGALALLEALQARLPSVASACDGIPEDVRDGEDALLVPPGDADALAAALRRTLTDRPLRERLSRGARATYERRFSGDRLASELAALYAEFGMRP